MQLKFWEWRQELCQCDDNKRRQRGERRIQTVQKQHNNRGERRIQTVEKQFKDRNEMGIQLEERQKWCENGEDRRIQTGRKG